MKNGEIVFTRSSQPPPSEDQSRLIERPITKIAWKRSSQSFSDLRFAASVAGAGQFLRHDPTIKDFDFERDSDCRQRAARTISDTAPSSCS